MVRNRLRERYAPRGPAGEKSLLAQAQSESAPRRVHPNDARLDHVALAHNLAWVRNPLGGELRDMDQTLNAILDLGKGAEGGQLRDLPTDFLAHLILLG